MAGRIILVIGPPGAGKSFYTDKLYEEKQSFRRLHDYHANAFRNSASFRDGRCFQQLIDGLRVGDTWVCNDVEWCDPARRRDVEDTLREEVPDVKIEWRCLDTSIDVCIERVQVRMIDSDTRVSQIERIERLHPMLISSPPDGCIWVEGR